VQRKEDEKRKQQDGNEGVVNTTAAQRPNSYIPPDELGLPKPFGTFAPFRPSAAPRTVRHADEQKTSGGTKATGDILQGALDSLTMPSSRRR